MAIKNNHWVVFATRWFDKRNGNTYHTVRLYKNSSLFTSKHFTYGYGSHYEQTAMELLLENNETESKSLYEFVQENDGNVLIICRDVTNKKNL